MPTALLSSILQNRVYLPYLRHMAHEFTVRKKLPTPGRCFFVNLVFTLYLKSAHTSIDGMAFFINSLGCGRLKKLWEDRNPAAFSQGPENTTPSSTLKVMYGKVIDMSRAG